MKLTSIQWWPAVFQGEHAWLGLILGFAGLTCMCFPSALPAVCEHAVCFNKCHLCLLSAFTSSPFSLSLVTVSTKLVYRGVSISTDFVSVMVPGGCCSQGCRGYLRALLAAPLSLRPFKLNLVLIHINSWSFILTA